VAYITNFERLAMEKGMLQEARVSVLDVLEEKFNIVPEEIQDKLQEIEERKLLRNLLRQAIHTSSLEEFLKLIHEVR